MEDQTQANKDEKLEQLSKAVKAALIDMRMILMLPPLSDSVLEDTSFLWAKTLFGKVPADRLDDSMRVALHLHQGGFPVTPAEVINGWDEIYQEQRTTSPKSGREACPFCIRISKNPGTTEVCSYHPAEE